MGVTGEDSGCHAKESVFVSKQVRVSKLAVADGLEAEKVQSGDTIGPALGMAGAHSR